jgi:hypothetical protein
MQGRLKRDSDYARPGGGPLKQVLRLRDTTISVSGATNTSIQYLK